jgi:hypothetical protein
VSVDSIMASRGFLHTNERGEVVDMSSLEDFKDYTGTCMRGPWDGFTLSAADIIIKTAEGTYRFLDGRWWWKKT